VGVTHHIPNELDTLVSSSFMSVLPFEGHAWGQILPFTANIF